MSVLFCENTKNLKNIFIHFLLSIISISSFSQVPSYLPKQGLIDWYNLNGNLYGSLNGSSSPLNTNFTPKYFNGKITPNSSIDTFVFFQGRLNGTQYGANDFGYGSDLIHLDQYDKSKKFSISMDVYGRSFGKIFSISNQDNSTTYTEVYSLSIDSTLLDINEWNNIIILVNDSIKVYINDDLKKSDKLTNPVSSSTKLTIGGYRGNRSSSSLYKYVYKEDCFTGYINNIRLWDISLNQLQIDSVSQVIQSGISDTPNSLTNKISLYPNPTSDYIIIDNNDYQKTSLTILNSIGQVVFNSNIIQSKYQVDVNNFDNGIYIIKVIKDGILIDTKKIIIQK